MEEKLPVTANDDPVPPAPINTTFLSEKNGNCAVFQTIGWVLGSNPTSPFWFWPCPYNLLFAAIYK